MCDTLSVIDIVANYLEEHGYHGLSNSECACLLKDLAPCGRMNDFCQAGWMAPCDCGDHDYHITSDRIKPKESLKSNYWELDMLEGCTQHCVKGRGFLVNIPAKENSKIRGLVIGDKVSWRGILYSVYEIDRAVCGETTHIGLLLRISNFDVKLNGDSLSATVRTQATSSIYKPIYPLSYLETSLVTDPVPDPMCEIKDVSFAPPAGVSVSEHCRKTFQQNCHICDDLDCGDNLTRRQRVDYDAEREEIREEFAEWNKNRQS